jgi:hypothetical protein
MAPSYHCDIRSNLEGWGWETSFFMKKIALTLALALVQMTTFAQVPAIQWQKCLGGTSQDGANSIQPTLDGGYIVVCQTPSTDGDVIGSYGGGDAWVVKLSVTGNLLWQKCLGGTSYDEAKSIIPTSDGGYIITGFTNSNNEDVTGNHGVQDAWVIKLSATGNVIWQKCLGGTSYDYAESIIPTPDGGYIVAGSTQSSDLDVTGNHGLGDAWIIKLSATGTVIWQKCLGGTFFEEATSIQTTPDGGYIMAGHTNSINGDITGNHGAQDAWVVKLAATGALVWQKNLGGTGEDYAKSIQPTSDGGYIVAGLTNSNNGDVIGNHGGNDAWLVKLSASGVVIWQKCLGGISEDSAWSIQTTSDDGFIVVGGTSSINGDVTGNYGSGDAWVVKLDSTGAIIWQKCLGGTSYDNAKNIQLTSDGGFIFAGSTNSIDGDVTGNHGSSDVWVVKLGPDLSTASFASQELKIFPNPTKNILQLQTANNGSLDKITITDLTGKIILIQTTNTAQINVEPLASGMYILEATSGEAKYSSKFVKE